MRTRALRTQPDDERKRRRDAVPSSVRDALRTPGEPLDRSTRELMEARFRFDFGHIRVHRDERASDAAGEIDAAAFTIGRHIVLGENVAPSTPHGRVLMAHELAHSSRDEHPLDALRLGSPHDVEETHANRAMTSTVVPPPYGGAQPVVRKMSGGAWAGFIGGGAALGGLIGLAAGPVGGLIGLGIGAVVGLVAGAITAAATRAPNDPGERRNARPLPTHLETTTATTLVSDPAQAATSVVSTLPRGTRVVDTTPANSSSPDWMRVRVTTGPNLGAVGWVRRSDVAQQPMTEILAPEDAQRLWTELSRSSFLANDDTNQRIPFHYPVDGCFARAFRMDQILEEAGYEAERVFVVSQRADSPPLEVQTPYGGPLPGGGRGVRWRYHVAPIVRVRDPQGGIVRIVLDPSITTGPVTIEQWTAIMSPEHFQELPFDQVRREMQAAGGLDNWRQSGVFTAPRTAYFPGNDPANPQASARDTMTDFAQLAAARELGVTIDGLLARPETTADQVIAAINAAPAAGRRYFAGERSDLVTRLNQRFSAADMVRIRTALMNY